ncbi:MAG: molybdopterin-dependent oxidoreductase [Adlercreutzia sp.]|uniref:molybdopterin-dependent oxidoreductase n=1 Tax=uncultured Adlercreutzia sp. TaxID=875803 RepID=UPI00216C8B44|nr:molybdopterin-dependent oxidoreductase [uncultured Adlercreutzia sp.]MCI8424413.1 molybdopterin-dependent oxidoreductase [Adlercreutzia sp.]
MNEKTRKIAGVAGSALMLTTMGAGAVTAFADEAPAAPEPAAAAQETGAAAELVTASEVQGTFGFTQGALSSLDQVQKAFKAANYLCGAGEMVEVDPAMVGDWAIVVKGEVQNPYVATTDEIIERELNENVVLGCSCAGNPADGAASVNVEVTGASVVSLLDAARPTADANTIVFTSADGYEVALPLTYIEQRYAPIVFAVNGSPLIDSVGGVNQLWLGSSSARYFARNIVSITLEARQTPPPAPGTPEAGDTYANLPNVGVAYGGEIA